MKTDQISEDNREPNARMTRSKRNSLIKALTANDIMFWGGDAFIGVILALFVVNFIDGATATHLGIAFMIQRVTNALVAIPIGRYFDSHKGYLDEVWGLTIASFFYGLVYVLLGFSTAIWQLYLAMFAFGVVRTIDLSSWRILFYGHISRGQVGEATGMYQTLFSFGLGLCMSLGGFAGERFGYNTVLIVGGLFIMAASFLPPLVKNYLPGRELQ